MATLVALGLLGVACATNRGVEDADAADLTALAVPGVDESALDRTVDPCTDFYAFACGGYDAKLPADTSRNVRGFSQLKAQQQDAMKRTMDAIHASPRTEAERKTDALYTSCLAGDRVPLALAYIAATAAEIDGASTTTELLRVSARLTRRDTTAFFSVQMQPNTATTGRRGDALILPSGFDLDTDYTDDKSMMDRIVKLVAAIQQADPSTTTADAKAMSAITVGIEQRLAKAEAAYWSSGELDSLEHPLGIAGLELAAPKIDWRAYFEALGRTDLGDFPIEELSVFADVADLITTSSLADLRTYLKALWYENATGLLFGADESDAAAVCDFTLGFLMPDAVEPRFLELAGVDGRAQAKARALFRAIMDDFGKSLDAEDFLDLPTRVEAKVKLEKMRAAIGASRSLDDYSGADVDAARPLAANWLAVREYTFARDLAMVGKKLPLFHGDFAPNEVNAAYSPSSNRVSVPGGILGGYFFSPAAKDVANFSAIGTVLGHELTHGFDNHGRNFDGNGTLRDWWSPPVSDEFNARAQCFVGQYGAFTVPGVTDPRTGQVPGHVDGKNTLGENIADNGGVKLAYRASKVEGMTEPVVAGFSPAQQFFIGYGQLWCGKSAPDVAAQALKNDVHSPSKARVNLPLSNFDAFARAFQCKAGSTMSPSSRCSVW